MTSSLRTDALARLSHGRLVVTLISKARGEHITLRLKAKNRDLNKRYMTLAESKIVGIDAGKVQEREFVGRSGETHEYVSGDPVAYHFSDKLLVPGAEGIRKNRGADPVRFSAACYLISWLRGDDLPASLEIRLEDFCATCGRQLTDPQSIDRGQGPTCYGRETDSRHQHRIPAEQLNLDEITV
jgi:hypothetical protein